MFSLFPVCKRAFYTCQTFYSILLRRISEESQKVSEESSGHPHEVHRSIFRILLVRSAFQRSALQPVFRHLLYRTGYRAGYRTGPARPCTMCSTCQVRPRLQQCKMWFIYFCSFYFLIFYGYIEVLSINWTDCTNGADCAKKNGEEEDSSFHWIISRPERQWRSLEHSIELFTGAFYWAVLLEPSTKLSQYAPAEMAWTYSEKQEVPFFFD